MSEPTECYFTVHKGMGGSCRGCGYSYNPAQFDSGCKLPYEIWEVAVKGIKPKEPIPIEWEENDE